MSNRLPDYLRMRVDAAPDPKSVVVCGDVRFTVITPRLIRIEQGAFTDDATQTVLCRNFCKWESMVQKDQHSVIIHTGYLHLFYRPGRLLEESLTISSLVQLPGQPGFTWRFGQKPLQNLGGTTSTLDCVDGECPLEDGLCSLDGYAVIDDSQAARMTQDGWFAPREKCTDVYFFGYGHDYTAAVQDYYRLTGVPGLLPAFALGNWWSRYHAYTAQEYLDLMAKFRSYDVPLSVGIVDMDWHITAGEDHTYGDGWTGYTWNEALFPDYRAFIRALHERGLKTALNLHPAQGVRKWDKQYEAMCAALGKDASTGKPVPFNCLNPDFLKAYFEILHFPYEEDGVDFWWMDWQQGGDYRAISGDDYRETGLDGVTPLWMLNHMHYLASRRKDGRGMIFSRYSGYGSQRYPIGFSGDTFITWASLRFQPYFTATASNVGYGWWSHDIGGHMGGVKDDELTVRWIQLGVFSPIFRLHSTDSIFLGREPWNYNKRAECIISDFMRLRHRLFPYLYTMNRRNHVDLLPLVRPMYHTHPECPAAYQVRNQYWFGSEMIVSPVTDPADSSDLARADVWFPEGVWTDAVTGYVYHGNQRLTVYRPMEEMPVFLKAGAIVPMQRHQAQNNRLGGTEILHVVVAPGASNSFRLYEDDGETLAYQHGAYAETPMTLDWSERAAVFTIGPVEGDTSLVPAKRRWSVEFRGWRRGCRVTVNGMPEVAAYVPETNACVVTLPEMSPGEAVTVRIAHDSGLVHDNSDCRDRIIHRLIRAQISQGQKEWLLGVADAALQRIAEGKPLRMERFAQDAYPSLGGFLREMIVQLVK